MKDYMLNNNSYTINYNGKDPTLCIRNLQLVINGKFYTFPEFCLLSDGSYNIDKDEEEFVTQGEWNVEFPENFPEKYKKDVLFIINDYIPQGCCGGCI